MKKVIAISGYGVKLGSTGNRFVIKEKDNEQKIVSDKISEILLYGKAINITTSAIMLAIKKGIPIFFMTRYGRPYSIVSPLVSSGTILAKREQYLAKYDERSIELVKGFVYGKLKNQERLLRLRANDIIKHDNTLGLKVRELANNIQRLASSIYDIENIAKVREVEAESAKYYWKGFALLLPDWVEFRAREHRGARDLTNSLLNYGYGFLLTRIMNSIIISGLDPYAGFLHADRPGRPSLALDAIEEFRQPIVDHTILKIFRLGMIKDDAIEDGKLTKDTISILLKNLKDRLEQKHGLHSIEFYMLEQSRNIARFLKREIKEYKPFMM